MPLLCNVVMSVIDSAERRCVDCGRIPPKTNTSYTLISSEHGWRLTKRVDADGQKVMEWRCPTCFKNYKKMRPPTWR